MTHSAVWLGILAPGVKSQRPHARPWQNASLRGAFDLHGVGIVARQGCGKLHFQVASVLLPGEGWFDPSNVRAAPDFGAISLMVMVLAFGSPRRKA